MGRVVEQGIQGLTAASMVDERGAAREPGRTVRRRPRSDARWLLAPSLALVLAGLILPLALIGLPPEKWSSVK